MTRPKTYIMLPNDDYPIQVTEPLKTMEEMLSVVGILNDKDIKYVITKHKERLILFRSLYPDDRDNKQFMKLVNSKPAPSRKPGTRDAENEPKRMKIITYNLCIKIRELTEIDKAKQKIITNTDLSDIYKTKTLNILDWFLGGKKFDGID